MILPASFRTVEKQIDKCAGEHRMKAMVEMELAKILIAETTDYQVIWLRERGGHRTFPILIGIVEAAAIDRKIRDISTPRPLTHDLLSSVITSLGARLDRIVISALRDNTFYAKLVLQCDGNTVEVDSRPSDAVAVATRLDAPIFVEEEVLDRVCSGEASENSGEPASPDSPPET